MRGRAQRNKSLNKGFHDEEKKFVDQVRKEKRMQMKPFVPDT